MAIDILFPVMVEWHIILEHEWFEWTI